MKRFIVMAIAALIIGSAAQAQKSTKVLKFNPRTGEATMAPLKYKKVVEHELTTEYKNEAKEVIRTDKFEMIAEQKLLVEGIDSVGSKLEKIKLNLLKKGEFDEVKLQSLEYFYRSDSLNSFTSTWDQVENSQPLDPYRLVKAVDKNAGFIPAFHKFAGLIVFCEPEISKMDSVPEEILEITTLNDGEWFERSVQDLMVTAVRTDSGYVYSSTEKGQYEVHVSYQEERSENVGGLVMKKWIPAEKVTRRISYAVTLEWTGEGGDRLATGTVTVEGMSFPVTCTRNGATFTQSIDLGGEVPFEWSRDKK